MKRTIIAAILNLTLCLGLPQDKALAASIGSWNAYMAYKDIMDIRPAGNMVYVLGSNSLFAYNADDGEVSVYNKVNSLSDCVINHIAWNSNAGRLIIIYDNYNIDLLDKSGNVTNISDYYSKTVNLDKTVNGIYVNGAYAYVYTNFGILKINMGSAEISDTYNLNMKVTACTIASGRIYARTSSGIYSADMSVNLLDRNNWQRDGSVTADIFRSENDMESTKKHGYDERRIYDNRNKCWWSNQEDGLLQSYTEAEDGTQTITRRSITPDNCPRYNNFAFMKYFNGVLYTCGSYIWDQYNDATIQTLDSDGWTFFQSDGVSDKTNVPFQDMLCLDVDPYDNRHVVAGSRNGVYEYYDGQFVRFHNSISTNGIIATAVTGDINYELITAMSFDNNGGLWCFNSRSFTQKPLLNLDRKGNWTAHGTHELLTYNNGRAAAFIKSMMTDSRGAMWFCNNDFTDPVTYRYDISGNTLNCYNHFSNQDGSTVNVQNVSCLAEDKEGNIWVGTGLGPLMLTPEQINNPSAGYTQVKVPRNDGTSYADYLLSGIDVTSIAIDGANRKWIGTSNNGVYLISSDNMEEIHHFTAENSYLLSNYIESIAINSQSGEVFFGTGNGLCSYMGDATEPNEDMSKDNVWAYPNPVRPEYTGLITVVGLSSNADVKILSSNGTVIAKGTSTGGTFTWNGKDSKGRRVASGVYMVATAKSDGSKGTVCKIAVIN